MNAPSQDKPRLLWLSPLSPPPDLLNISDFEWLCARQLKEAAQLLQRYSVDYLLLYRWSESIVDLLALQPDVFPVLINQETREATGLGFASLSLESLSDPLAVPLLRAWCERWRAQQQPIAVTHGDRPRQDSSDLNIESFYDLASIGLVRVDREGVILEANALASHFLGGPNVGLSGYPLVALLPPDQGDAISRSLSTCLRLGQPLTPFDIRSRDSLGTIRHMQVGGKPIFCGPQPTLQLTLTDISREVEMRHTVLLMQELLVGVIEQLDVGVLTCDAQGLIEMANSSAEDMFGHRSGGLSQLPLQQLFDVNVYGLTTGQPATVHCLRHDNTRFPAELRTREVHVERQRKLVVEVRDLSLERSTRQELFDIREEQRRAIGQELHDDLGQQLTAIAFVAEVVHDKLRREKRPEVEIAGQVATLAKQAVAKTRALARGLYPTPMERGGLEAALLDLLSSTEELYGIRCSLHFGVELGLEQRALLHLYRIAQEAITNAVRHARASQIEVTLYLDSGDVVMEIRDNGKGLTVPAEGLQSFGMRSMRQHAELLDSHFSIESEPNRGTQISCRVSNRPYQPRVRKGQPN